MSEWFNDHTNENDELNGVKRDIRKYYTVCTKIINAKYYDPETGKDIKVNFNDYEYPILSDARFCFELLNTVEYFLYKKNYLVALNHFRIISSLMQKIEWWMDHTEYPQDRLLFDEEFSKDLLTGSASRLGGIKGSLFANSPEKIEDNKNLQIKTCLEIIKNNPTWGISRVKAEAAKQLKGIRGNSLRTINKNVKIKLTKNT